MKLNVGCGKDIRDGYTNLDIRPLKGVDIVCDMWHEPIPLDDDSVDEILAKDVLEHFPLDKTDDIIKEWKRVLKPGGFMQIEVPNIILNFANWVSGSTKCLKGQHITERFSQIIFGRQDYPGNFHYQLFDDGRLKEIAARHGMESTPVWLDRRALCVKFLK